MPKHKLKPNYKSTETMRKYIQVVSDYFGNAYDDRMDWDRNHVTLSETARKFNTSILRIRKILITANKYSIEQSRIVQQYAYQGMTVPEIMIKTGLSRASVHSYLPYSKLIYNMQERSVGADRIARWREQHNQDSPKKH